MPIRRPSCRFIAGNEAAGEVTTIGEGVTAFKPGDRVAYVVGLGCYAAERNVPVTSAVRLPEGVSDEVAAAMMLKGLTTEYLLHRVYKVKAGDTILMHAAAGGVGLILCQWAKHLGATVIGTVGNEEKAELAPRERLRSHDPVPVRGLREACRRDHRRQKGAGGL